MPIKETNYLKPFCDWKQLWEETEFEIYNGDKTIVYKPTPIPSEVKHFERMLEWFADDEYDDYEHLPKWEAVRICNGSDGMYWDELERRNTKRTKHNTKFITKPKENK